MNAPVIIIDRDPSAPELYALRDQLDAMIAPDAMPYALGPSGRIQHRTGRVLSPADAEATLEFHRATERSSLVGPLVAKAARRCHSTLGQAVALFNHHPEAAPR